MRGPVEAAAIIQILGPPEVAWVAHRDPPLTAGVLAAANKPTGHVMVTEPGTVMDVAVLKATVTAATAPGTLLPPVIVAKVILPPNAPVDAPAEILSTVDCTVRPRVAACLTPVVIAVNVTVTVTPVAIG